MKSCPHCQQEILDNAVKCVHCGQWVAETKNIRGESAQGVALRTVEYYTLPLSKLAVLSFCTLGLYDWFWFYKNWKALHQQGEEGIIPGFRTVFTFIFCYSLFNRIALSTQQEGYKGYMDSIAMTILYLGMRAAIFTPDPFWGIYFLAIIPLVFVQKAINFNNAAINPAFQMNHKFSMSEIFIATIGGIFVVALVVGLILPK